MMIYPKLNPDRSHSLDCCRRRRYWPAEYSVLWFCQLVCWRLGENCALFCAHPQSRIMVDHSNRAGRKSPAPVRRINTIAKRRIQWEERAPQLLTEGLLVRI